jgi:predicted nucleic acid-binding protein
MKIYLDNCCLNRPFDDQSNLRIKLESEAIKVILSLCEQEEWHLISSEVVEFEIQNTPDQARKKELEAINSLAGKCIQINQKIVIRAKEFEDSGIQTFDAMHLACAENKADILLTTDDKFLKKSLKINNLKIKINNPIKWLEEVLS